jgi:hypothetical protein
MTTIYETLSKIEGFNDVEYVDSFKNKWMSLREDDSNVEDMKRLIIFVCNLLIDIISEKNEDVAKMLEDDLKYFEQIIEEVKNVEELERILELHIYDIFAILSKI